MEEGCGLDFWDDGWRGRDFGGIDVCGDFGSGYEDDERCGVEGYGVVGFIFCYWVGVVVGMLFFCYKCWMEFLEDCEREEVVCGLGC